MSFLSLLILAVVQGLAELLPVSSSAHVIFAEKLMGLDPSSAEMTFLLVMLHLGTMLAVIFCFWRRWLTLFQQGGAKLVQMTLLATVFTGVVGYGLKIAIEKIVLGGGDKAEIEQLFGNLYVVAVALAMAGLLILLSSAKRWRKTSSTHDLTAPRASAIGLLQGLCLPFRGFSRSGATISTAMIAGMDRRLAEEFSFLLAIVLTPPVIGRELLRLLKANTETHVSISQLLLPGLMGMVLSFAAGTLAIRWLSSWLETDRWHYFGVYCLVFAAVIGGYALQY